MEPQLKSDTDQLIELAFKREQIGDMSGALRLARQALAAARDGNHPLDCARAMVAVARYRFRLGQYEDTRQLALEALAMTNPTQEASAVIYTEALLMLGMCAVETNSLVEGEGYYRRAADLAREIGDKLLFQRSLHNLGSAIYLMHGKFDLAITADSQALQICREYQFTDWALYPLITLAIAYQITNRRQPARETLAELRAQAHPGSAGVGYACYVDGMLALDDGDLMEAEAQLSQARAIAELLGDPSLNLDTRLGLSRLYRLRSDSANAYAWAEDALQFASRVGYRIYQGRARMDRGRAAWLNGDIVAAETDYRQAFEIFTEMEMRCDQAEVQLLLAYALHQRKDSQAGSMFYQAGYAIQAGGYEFILERERSWIYPLVAAYQMDANAGNASTAGMLLDKIQGMAPERLKIHSLGGLDVWVGARHVETKALRQRRAGELLMLLLTSPGYSLSSAQVTEAMCPEKDPKAAIDFYHHAISTLRRLLEPELPDRRFPCRYLDVDDERVTLIVAPGSVFDFNDFENHFRNNEWDQAISLYQGEYLPMFRYAEWSITLRQHLADLYEQALLHQAMRQLQGGEPAVCLGLVRRVLLHNPWQEQAVALGMRAALTSGDRATAIKLYQRLVKVLDTALGIAPQKEHQQLYITACKQSVRGK